jgi:hypothetical protein
MKWREFSYYLGGLDHSTPLGTVVSIRAENDPQRLKDFTPEQRRIRNKWRSRMAKKKPQKDTDAAIAQIQAALASLAGGPSHENEEA